VSKALFDNQIYQAGLPGQSKLAEAGKLFTLNLISFAENYHNDPRL